MFSKLKQRENFIKVNLKIQLELQGTVDQLFSVDILLAYSPKNFQVPKFYVNENNINLERRAVMIICEKAHINENSRSMNNSSV